MAEDVAGRPLEAPVAGLPRATKADATRLEKLGVRTVRDLLLYLPVGWDSFGGTIPIADLREGAPATVAGRIRSIQAKRTPRRNMALTEATLIDGSGWLKVVWFNQPYLARQLKSGDRIAVAGAPRRSRWGPGLEMQNPHHELIRGDGDAEPTRIGGMMPKYGLTQGLSHKRVAMLVEQALPLADRLEDTVPAPVRERHGLLTVAEAVRQGHQPETTDEWHQARRRMQFAELMELQTAFLLANAERDQERAPGIPYVQAVIDRFKEGLEFELTHAQKRSVWEIYKDLPRATPPMNRMLNGDVGSGKTAVAAAAAAMVHAAGRQTVVMAPTELLARQHLGKFRDYLETSFPDLKVELLVSGQPAAERRRVRTAAASGHCAVLVGTHALIEDDVELLDLGLAVVDEQHRFGTRQREALRRKARGDMYPHFLAMTATPIPRSLALALYGEMELSALDELPPGRTPVGTAVVPTDAREQAYDLVRREVGAGHQAFVICPQIEADDKQTTIAATEEFERLKRDVFPDLRLALVHGKLKDKDAVMTAFRDRESDVLVATAVIEVGVDVPNATVMMIEGAERFGLAQLHQFRGRVGRSSFPSHCLLLTGDDDLPASTLRRLELMTRTDSGFVLAQQDLELRGAGELMGQRQHGMSDLAMGALLQPRLVSEIRDEAERTLREDPSLSATPALREAALRRLEQTSIS
jgi:ATP-dependent DNA helicase RecG